MIAAAEATAAKLSPKYEGPFVVLRRKGYNVYEVKEPRGKKSHIVHVKDLKPYFQANPEVTTLGAEPGRTF